MGASSLYAQSPLPPPLPGYELVFSDEFEGNRLDTLAWWASGKNACATHGAGHCEEDMWYKPENIAVQEGRMVIIAKEDPTTCEGKFKEYSSGWVQTGGNFKYGYYEIRAKIPAGNGFWPAFWLTAPDIDLAYDEIDVFEFCGCNCKKYQVGYFYEIDHDSILANNVQHEHAKIRIGNNACENFNTYGVEWTASHIRFFLNGILQSAYSNQNVHDPMALILNLAVGGCYGGCNWTSCGFLKWDTDNGCHVTCKTEFPQTYEIDWVRGWQKNREAVYVVGEREMRVGNRSALRVPQYPHARYEWACTPGLQVAPDTAHLNFDRGIWQYAAVTALSAGSQSVTVSVTFPGGYTETQVHAIQVVIP